MSSLATQTAATIRAEMARRRLTQRDLAAIIGKSVQTTNRRLNVGGFTVSELEAIAERFGLPITVLITEPQAQAS